MELINDPDFWEIVGAIVILMAAAPIVYAIYVVARSVYDAWKRGEFRNEPTAKIVDPTFGELRLFANRGWEGEIIFSPTDRPMNVSIDATNSGPTDDQRTLLKQIEDR